MSENQSDLIVIGSGPGGYVAAIKAAQLGFKNVVCIDKRSTLGGTCLNVGCIPSKALLYSSEKYEDARKHFFSHGIVFGSLGFDLKAMLARKDHVVHELTQGIQFLFKKNKINHIVGTGTLIGNNQVEVTLADGSKQVWTAQNILIATGSESISIPGVNVDEERIVSSTGALSLQSVPERLVVVGGGYIGLELGSVWRRLGSDVTIVEYFDSIVPAMDKEVSKQLHKMLEKQGLKFKLSTKVEGVEKTSKKLKLSLTPASGEGEKETLECDVLLLSIGRKPNTEDLGAENVGLKMDERGRIEVNHHFKTNIPGIYAIGDVIKGPMLAHKAEEEGIAAVEIMAGQSGHVNYNAIPAVVYTAPEVATVGVTEEEAKASGTNYKVGKFPFSANSRAKAMGETEGFVKMISDAKTDRLLGVHIIGIDAGTLIAEAVTVMEFGGSSEDLARTCHAHPTLNEAVKEAALATFFKPIHM